MATSKKNKGLRGSIIAGPTIEALCKGYFPTVFAPEERLAKEGHLATHRFTLGGYVRDEERSLGQAGSAVLEVFIRALEIDRRTIYFFRGGATLVEGEGEVYERAKALFAEPDTFFQHVSGAYGFSDQKLVGYMWVGIGPPISLVYY